MSNPNHETIDACQSCYNLGHNRECRHLGSPSDFPMLPPGIIEIVDVRSSAQLFVLWRCATVTCTRRLAIYFSNGQQTSSSCSSSPQFPLFAPCLWQTRFSEALVPLECLLIREYPAGLEFC